MTKHFPDNCPEPNVIDIKLGSIVFIPEEIQ